MKRLATVVASIAVAGLLAGCQTAAQHAADVRAAQDTGDRVTVGKVQREIRVGMTNAQVVEVLGAPNMVTTDEQRRENWVYDKIATDTAYSSSSGGVNALILGGGLIGGAGAAGGGAGAGYSSGAGARSTSQRTLTIIIKYDEANKVRDFSYRSSSF
jgi:outer membrane protein assembly factor BamE (lipoprotein component of BamABCDE complex)